MKPEEALEKGRAAIRELRRVHGNDPAKLVEAALQLADEHPEYMRAFVEIGALMLESHASRKH